MRRIEEVSEKSFISFSSDHISFAAIAIASFQEANVHSKAFLSASYAFRSGEFGTSYASAGQFDISGGAFFLAEVVSSLPEVVGFTFHLPAPTPVKTSFPSFNRASISDLLFVTKFSFAA